MLLILYLRCVQSSTELSKPDQVFAQGQQGLLGAGHVQGVGSGRDICHISLSLLFDKIRDHVFLKQKKSPKYTIKIMIFLEYKYPH